MDIQIGDRITYRNKKLDKIFIVMVYSYQLIDSLQDIELNEILKIERPKYEVVEGNNELLTDEEREFLRLTLKFEDTKIAHIRKTQNVFDDRLRLEINGITTGHWIFIKDNYFNNLELNKNYELKELGLEE